MLNIQVASIAAPSSVLDAEDHCRGFCDLDHKSELIAKTMHAFKLSRITKATWSQIAGIRTPVILIANAT